MNTITFDRKHPLATLAALGLAAAIAMGLLAGAASAQNAGGLRSAEGLGLPPLPGSMGGGSPNRQPAQQGEGNRNALDPLMAWERQDMGVRPSRELHEGAFHGPTPNQIPGGQVITTKGLVPLLQQGMAVQVFDVLGGQQTLPNAIPAAWAAQPGSFDDDTQRQLAQMLRQATRGRADMPLVFYCGGPQCWMSYNAALRAIQLGYRNVLWYRGGLEAWQRAGLQVASAQAR